MSDELKRDRSPNYPKVPLSQAIEMVEKLYKKIGKSKVKREAAMGVLGYTTASGAALTALGVLNQYGLIDQDRGSGVSITPLAISLLHPTSLSQAQEAKIEAALSPKVFNVLYTEGFHHASEDALANNLIQNGFTPDGAKTAAAVYLENISFSNLDSEGIRGPSDSKKEDIKMRAAEGKLVIDPRLREVLRSEDPPKRSLATYSFPLGQDTTVKLEFSGSELNQEHLKALVDFVGLIAKQYGVSLKPLPPLPANAMLKGSDGSSKAIRITEFVVETNGVRWFSAEDGTRYREQDLTF